CLLFCCIFFFSSRRRHTRSKRDWSSDVCSSDLEIIFWWNDNTACPLYRFRDKCCNCICTFFLDNMLYRLYCLRSHLFIMSFNMNKSCHHMTCHFPKFRNTSCTCRSCSNTVITTL